jgi:hypothetical protein
MELLLNIHNEPSITHPSWKKGTKHAEIFKYSWFFDKYNKESDKTLYYWVAPLLNRVQINKVTINKVHIYMREIPKR